MTNTNNNIYLANALSLQMMDSFPAVPVIEEITDIAEIKRILSGGFVSAIGHTDTATVVSDIVGMEVPTNRISLKLKCGDTLIVAQFMGGRLPEGATTLPEGIKIKFLKIRVLYEKALCTLNRPWGKEVCDFITTCPCDCDLIG